MSENWLIAVDLDGTLFHTDHQVSVRTLNTMHTMAEIGHSIVIVTGRSSHSCVPRLMGMPQDIRLLCSNGAYEYDRATQNIRWVKQLPASRTLDIQRSILAKLPSASFGWETVKRLVYEDQFIREAGGAHTLEQGGVYEPLGDVDVIKMFVRTPELKGDDLAKSLKAILGPETEVASSGVPFVEITANGVNKGNALAKVAQELGFKSSHAIAFGDNSNDMSMLRWAGESVAMGNAVPEIRAIASAHALSHAEDGVAQYLEGKFLP